MPTDALLGFSLQGTHGASFSEELVVRCDGKLNYVAAAPLSGNEIGKYETQISSNTLHELNALARELLAVPDFVPSLPPQGAELSVSVHSKPQAYSWELRPDAQSAHSKAATLHATLLQQARKSPLAAVSFESKLQGKQLAVIATHRGKQPLELTLDDHGVRVSMLGAPVPSSSEAKPAIGFVTANVKLLDGIHQRAEFAKGVRAALVVDLPPESAGAKGVRAELSGTLWLPGDESALPTRSFRVTATETVLPKN